MGLKKHPFAFSFAVCLFQSDQKLKTQRIHLPSKINLEVFLLGVYLSAGALCFRFFSLNPYKPPCCPLCFFMLAVFQGFLFSTPPTYSFLFPSTSIKSFSPSGNPLGPPWTTFPPFSLFFPLHPSGPSGTPWVLSGTIPHFSPLPQLPKKQKGPGNSPGPLPVTCPFPLLSSAEYLLSTAAE